LILKRDETFKVVFNLRTPTSPNSEEVGTGTFVVKSNGEMYMVTASHVAKNSNINTQVVISDQVGNAKSHPLVEFNGQLAWRHHPVADLAVLQIYPSSGIEADLQNRFFPYDHFEFNRLAPSRDFELTCVGFPNGLGAAGLFSPLTYRSYTSSSLITMNRFDAFIQSEFFLLENPSVGGYSGCPVFDLAYMVVGSMTTTKEKTICYGIMHGTLGDNTGGKLAAVTPAYYLPHII
jgi:hypothetical protein